MDQFKNLIDLSLAEGLSFNKIIFKSDNNFLRYPAHTHTWAPRDEEWGWVREGISPSRNGGSGYYPRKILEILYPDRAFWTGEYLYHNWSTEWVHFVLNTDVQVFLNQLSY